MYKFNSPGRFISMKIKQEKIWDFMKEGSGEHIRSMAGRKLHQKGGVRWEGVNSALRQQTKKIVKSNKICSKPYIPWLLFWLQAFPLWKIPFTSPLPTPGLMRACLWTDFLPLRGQPSMNLSLCESIILFVNKNIHSKF